MASSTRAGQREGNPLRSFLAILAFALTAGASLQLSLYRADLPPEASWQLRPFLANVALLCGYAAFWRLVVPRPMAAFAIATGGVGLVALLNFYKVNELGEPLMLFDLFQLGNVPVLLRYVPAGDWGLLALAVLVLVMLWRGGGVNQPRRRRSLALEVALLALATILGRSFTVDGESWAKRTFATVDVFWDPLARYSANGFIVASLLDVPQLAISVPDFYEAGHERELLRPFLDCEPSSTGGTRPHVVVAMLESFWDPTGDGLEFDRDPLPSYRRLRERGSVQHFVSPVFGSRTANAEFEVLTALSTRFSPLGSIPYQQYVKRPIESLASHFDAAGYHTVAIHNFRRNFWNRDAVYPMLGFHEYIALEDLGDVPWELGWPSDAALFSRVERILAEADRPTFVFAVTVATHGPYSGLAPTVHLIDSERPQLVAPMSIYASKLALLDQHFGDFIARLDLLPEPPWVITFSDHLPTVAAQVLPADPASGTMVPRSRVVEALILGPGDTAVETATRSLTCLGPQILRVAGIPPSPFFRYVEGLCAALPVVSPSTLFDGGEEALEAYRWLTYDRLFGQAYSTAACGAT